VPVERVRLALAALGAALGLYAIGLAIWEPGALTQPVAVHVAIGWSFVACGLVAWRGRPDNRTGLLMTLAGLVWFCRDFDRWGGSVPTRLSELSQNVFLALVAHQVVVFPHGSARSRLERALVAAVYSLAFGGYVVSELFPATNDLLSALAIPLAVAIIFVVVDKWRTATPPGRRVLTPILWAGPPVLVVVTISVARDYLDVNLAAAGDTIVDWLQLVYTALPLAFLAGVLRTRLHRAALGDLVLELSDVTSPERVRTALAHTLGDPSLELAFWVARQQRYVGLDGSPFALPEDGDRAVRVLDGHTALVCDRSLLDDPELVEAAGAAARLALENARLQTELRGYAAHAPVTDEALSELSPREREVLALLAEGRTDRGIARQLYVTPKTVEAHVRSIFRKLDLPAEATENRRVHAVLTYLRARAG
jgi:DNA-binding CsgD family transcriptional regulator